MPSEERFITFELPEIYKALSILSIQEDKPALPAGELGAIHVTEDAAEDATVSVHVKTKSAGEEDLKFERAFFAKALVFYCQGSGIPLPKSGQKILNIMKDKIILKISLDQ